jgi:aspartyl-tRNA(Asn)/glutamyl-tRNA(Gln) amidotransferase subunit A
MKSPLTIDQLHLSLKKKEYSIVELLDGYFARIKANEDLNAFITLTDDYAYKRAKKLQRVVADSPRAFVEFPLLGVPVAMKDLYLTKGIRTTAASKVLENYISVYSSTVFERLEAAGAILVGKANCDAWAHGSTGENSDFGVTKNPWDKRYVSGGSSSGSAVSVAANLALVSPGTDTCGSIRLPANFCGVTGLKPTYGAVSRYGVVAMASSLDTMGHITRSVEDSQRVFRITRGVDGKDSTLVNFKYSIFSSKNRLKIGIPKEFVEEGLNKDVKTAVEDFADFLRRVGHEIIEVSLPSTKYAISIYYIIQPAEVSSNLGRYDGIRYGNNRSHFGMESKRRIMLGTFVLSSGYYDAYYNKAMKARSLIIKEVEKAFDKVDLLLAPVSPSPPFKLGTKTSDPLEMYLTDIFAATANLTGIPSLALPTGFTNKGLPLGVQLMGPRFSEEMLFEIGKSYQLDSDYHTKLPLT